MNHDVFPAAVPFPTLKMSCNVFPALNLGRYTMSSWPLTCSRLFGLSYGVLPAVDAFPPR